MSGERCPKCHELSLQMGYGLTGGGIGPYQYCDNEKCDYFEKWQDAELTEPGPHDDKQHSK
jgi:hypothetical protein